MHFKYILRFWENIDNQGPDECWLWKACTDHHGRGVMTITVAGVPYNIKAPRFAFWERHGRWPEGYILHSCDTPLCCNPAHLREGTQAENMADAVARGRMRHGEDHHRAKLTPDDVRAIRKLADEGCSQAELARRYGVDRRPIRAILNGETWKHVK